MSQRELVGEDPMTSPELSSPAIELSNDVPSRVTYKFQVQKDYRGWRQPIELGMGNFAAVYQGQQYVGGRPSRSVAIKILHNHATYVHEALFTQEIHHLRKLSDAGAELYACQLAVDMFRLKKEDLVPQIKDVISAVDFYDKAAGSQIIFI